MSNADEICLSVLIPDQSVGSKSLIMGQATAVDHQLSAYTHYPTHIKGRTECASHMHTRTHTHIATHSTLTLMAVSGDAEVSNNV